MTDRLRSGLADLAAAAAPVDLSARVHRGVRRVARRNRALAATAGVLLVTGSVAGYVTLWPVGQSPAPGPGNTPSSSPSESANPTPTMPDVDVHNATFTVPTYPGPWGNACPEGERTFVDSTADAGPTAKLWMPEGPPLRGDIDGTPGDEIVLMVQCATEGASDPNPLAARIGTDGAITVLGWVNVAADGELLVLDPAEPVEISNGSVQVVVIGRYSDLPRDLDKQARAFAYRDGRMVQVDGPTAFPEGTTDGAAIDLNNTTVYVSTNDEPGDNGSINTYAGYVRLRNGTGTAYFEKIVDSYDTGSVQTEVRVLQAMHVTTGSRVTPVAVLEVTPADAPPRIVVMAYHHNEFTGYAARDPVTVYTAPPGVTDVSVEAGTDQLTVTVDGRAQLYQFNADMSTGPRWIGG